MLWKIFLLSCCLAITTTHIKADDVEMLAESVDVPIEEPVIATETSVQHSISFETSHKRPGDDDSSSRNNENDDSFHTAHKIAQPQLARALNVNTATGAAEMEEFEVDVNSMNLLPTKERPELNPVLSALINEDVMKSIEAKRAIEQAELDMIKAENDAAVEAEQEAEEIREQEEAAIELHEDQVTVAPLNVLTTVVPEVKRSDLDDDDLNMGFVDQTINLDVAGSENNKKSRIEIKKGPNGQEYEYEYVYYYEDEEAEAPKEVPKEKPKSKSKSKDSRTKPTAAAAAVHEEEVTVRGKSRYTNIERNGATATDNSLQTGKSKGRSRGAPAAAAAPADEIEVERLPTNTRFPSRGKNIDVAPTPAIDSLENAAEKKRISVKRPSLELVDSETFNTDEKQVKGTRNGDTEAEAKQQRQQAANKPESSNTVVDAAAASNGEDNEEESATMKRGDDEDAVQTTPSMEKAALDLYAIIANANSDFNMEETSTDRDMDGTTIIPGVTNDDEDGLTTLMNEISSTTTTTTTTSTTTTTTTPAPTTTTTTTTTAAPSLFGKRGGPGAAGRNRFKSNKGATTTTTAAPSAEANEPAEQPKSVKNRFSRPLPGARNRGFNARTTSAPAAAAPAEEEEVAVKETKPVSSGFGRGRPRNRFNLRGSTTTSTEKPASEDGAQEEIVPSSTARPALRSRPALNLRGRNRLTTKAPVPATEEENSAANDKNEVSPAGEEKPVAAPHAPARPGRFNLNRAAGGSVGNRLLPRGKYARTTEAPTDDSAADSSHHSDVKGEGNEASGDSENPAEETPTAAAGNRLKVRPRLGNLHKTENLKPHAASASPSSAAAAPRKVNPLLAKRRLHLPNAIAAEAASSTEKSSSTSSEEVETSPKDEARDGENGEVAESSNKDDTTEVSAETPTTKQQARGLGLLGQRRRLPLRKPGTIN